MTNTFAHMPLVLKRNTPADLIQQIQQIENQSDRWMENLAISAFPFDTAIWGVLTQIILLIEDAIERYGHGSQKQREAMTNLGRAGALVIETLRRSELPVKPVWLRWTADLREATKQATLAANSYDTFISCFTMWHKNRVAAEIQSPDRVRFSTNSSPIDRRIQAYLQGARIRGWPATQDNPVGKDFVDEPEVHQLVSRLLGRVEIQGALAIQYPEDSELLSGLRDIYDRRLELTFRRPASLDLGGYDLRSFRRCFSVLVAVCSVHELVCAVWSKQRGRYPFESAVMVKSKEDWYQLIGRFSGIPEHQVRMMIADLTSGSTVLRDLYTHPFVASLDRRSLFLVPHFILNSRAEENILRVCSHVRSHCYSAIQNAKEREMRERIKASIPARYSVIGPLNLPDPTLPDIDLVITDTEKSAVLIGELKWLRKTLRVVEYLDKDAELEKGFQQVRALEDFLARAPHFLSERGIVAACDSPPQLSFVVIARDHLDSPPEGNSVWLAEFDALIWALQKSKTLRDSLCKLQSYEWLPVENVDFTVRFEPASVSGVTIDAEVFHRVEVPASTMPESQ